jgi:hypothetical protein
MARCSANAKLYAATVTALRIDPESAVAVVKKLVSIEDDSLTTVVAFYVDSVTAHLADQPEQNLADTASPVIEETRADLLQRFEELCERHRNDVADIEAALVTLSKEEDRTSELELYLVNNYARKLARLDEFDLTILDERSDDDEGPAI